MKTIRKSCNIGYHHKPHGSVVVLLDEAGKQAPAVWLCGGTDDPPPTSRGQRG